MSPALLDVDEVTLRFRGLLALDGVSFAVGAEELLALIGPNGAGKTSILNCLNQVYRPQRGSIRLDGVELVGRRPSEMAALGVARTFQNVALFPRLDVVDNVMLGRHHLTRAGFVAGALRLGRARREEAANRARCEELVELLGLGRWRHRAAGATPFGVQKRIELARALAMEPKLLLLDEPAAGMSRAEAGEMVESIAAVRTSRRLSIVLVEHDMHVVTDLADRVTVLDFGRVIATGAPGDVQQDPKVVEAYLGRLPGAGAPTR